MLMKGISDKVSATLTVIIATKDRTADCIRCINSILAQTVLPYEIVIVEATGSGKVTPLAQAIENMKDATVPIVYVPVVQPGLTRQRNLGVSLATGEIVLFTDDDTVFEIDCIEQLQRAYNEVEDSVAGIQPAVIQRETSFILSRIMREVFLLSGLNNGKPPYMKSSGFPCLAHNPQRTCNAQVFCGVASYRRRIFEQFHFDEYLVGYGAMEDIDFSYRVSRSYSLCIYPEARIHHFPASEGRDKRDKYYEMAICNHWYLFKKNIPKNVKNYVAFVWANLGNLLLAVINSIRWRTTFPLVGTVHGIIKGLLQ